MDTQTTIENPVQLAVADDEAKALRLAIDHARRGNAVAARILLVDICARNPNNELAWLWRASLATTAEEGLGYMDQVLRLNPQNRTALGWLEKMGRPAPVVPAALAGQTAPRQPSGEARTDAMSAQSSQTQSSPTQSSPTQPNQTPGQPTQANSAQASPGPGRVSDPPASTPLEPRKPIASCPICSETLEATAARCSNCRAILRLTNLIDFALSRPIDTSAAAHAIERWSTDSSVEADVALAVIHLNLLDYAKASHHLNQAVQRGLPPSAPPLVADGQLRKALSQPVVMVVDDSATIRDVVVRTLGPHEILPLPVGNAWDVVDIMLAQKPHLVLLDVTMPGVDGLEVCRKIRANKQTRHIPVVMLTGHDALIDKLVGKMAGATEYLTKPFKPEALLRTVKKYLEKRRG